MTYMSRDQKEKAGWGAFPNVTTDGCDSDMGITTRDYFAAKADVSLYGPKQALESKLDRQATMLELAEYIVQLRYLEADAMLAERVEP